MCLGSPEGGTCWTPCPRRAGPVQAGRRAGGEGPVDARGDDVHVLGREAQTVEDVLPRRLRQGDDRGSAVERGSDAALEDLPGEVDEVKIYDFALSAAAVRSIFESSTGRQCPADIPALPERSLLPLFALVAAILASTFYMRVSGSA